MVFIILTLSVFTSEFIDRSSAYLLPTNGADIGVWGWLCFFFNHLTRRSRSKPKARSEAEAERGSERSGKASGCPACGRKASRAATKRQRACRGIPVPRLLRKAPVWSSVFAVDVAVRGQIERCTARLRLAPASPGWVGWGKNKTLNLRKNRANYRPGTASNRPTGTF